MRGVVYNGVPFEMAVQDVPVPQILNATDAIVKITTSALCGSDLHTYHGITGAGTPPWVMGHEAMGYVTSVGDGVSSLSVGDYVVIADTPHWGHLAMEPQPLAFFGGGAGGLGGLQSEFARIPFADESLIPVPLTHETTNRTIEQDYLTVSDIFATAWLGLEWSGFEVGDTVAVFGAGPVGLLVAYSAIIQRSSDVYVIDHIQQRLDIAESIGAIPINFNNSDPVTQILEREPGGILRVVDAVGNEAVNADGEKDPELILSQAVRLAHIGGGIGQVGFWRATQDTLGAPLGSTMPSNMSFPLSNFFSKRLRLQSGPVDVKLVAAKLVNLIASGHAKPGFIKSAEIGINEAPEYYRRFDAHEEVKVYIHFD
ncbi:related to formaldehyde dehydrogenase [Fusarium oxysporum]|uniref:Related to formaldehyde dehydrogenase n=1 Tax=Fusarium oxysporum TaxID=5507 RepID=A0A2H3TRK8_FUSOX|nr:related to formaldehyde dehydrogenase [Fusarium oxysporum]